MSLLHTLQAIEESVYVHEKFPLIIDPTGKAKMFLKYQTGSFITQPEFANKELINRCLAGCIIHVWLQIELYITNLEMTEINSSFVLL